MLSNYGYGLTDDSPNTPWNESEVPEKDFDVCVSQTLSKNTTIVTQDYLPEFDEESGRTYANTEDTDWNKAYCDSAMTPLEIINAAGKIAKALLEQGETRVGGVYLKTFAEECKDWGEDELTVMEE
jgi:hypothetical protein